MSDSLKSPVLDIPWGFGLLHAMEDRPDEARAALEEGVAMARDEDNHWALFECLSRLSMLDVTEGNLAAVEERDADLRSVADKLGEGSERALAATLLALARRKAGGEPGELEAALETLRAADSKGLLVERVRTLKTDGYTTGIITNNVAEFGDGWRGLIPVDELFDFVVDSSSVGVRKPDPRIFQLALQQLEDVPPERAVFLDDYQANVDAARALGLNAITVGADLAAVIRELDELLA